MVDVLASGLLRKILSLAAEELIQAWGLKENLQELRERLKLVYALLSDVDSKSVTANAVQVWLKKLKDVARDADELMEELHYEVLRTKVEGRKVCDFIFRFIKNILMSHKIKNINISLDKIFKRAKEIGLRPVDVEHQNATAQRKEIRHTPPSIDETQIVGRDDDTSKVVKLLCENKEKDLSVIAVVGLGGLGKTTLARLVYKSDDVMRFFQKKIWVTVSDDFDVIRVLNEMVQSLTKTNPQFSNFEAAIKKLQESLKGETFLLVLDDVWNQDSKNWDDMRSCLVDVGGAKGSKIMVTTRKDEVVSAMQISPPYQVVTHKLLELSEDNSWKLFKQITFREGGVVENDNLEAMGRRMVERCGGLPLAIKALGGLLYSKKSEQDWMSIQNSETWVLSDVLPSLKLTYNNLPSSSLKHCFAYCATFPKDFDIEKDKLIQIWMALGLLLPPRGSNLAMEDIGNEYFSTLLGNYLLQDVEKDKYDNIIGCKMHDLVHDLALDASRNFCETSEAGKVNHVSEAVHVWLDVAKDTEPKISKGSFKRVQTLHLMGGILGNMIPNLTYVTVLVLDSYRIEELPNSVGHLKYLRYLDITSTSIEELPDSITTLYNLQTLRFSSLRKLPKKLGNLINMRHMISYPYGTPNMNHTFIGIKWLTCLQTLSYFVVGRDKELCLENLGGLNNLKGNLSIYGLEEVTNMGDASKANLWKKSKIQCLEFHWKFVGRDLLEDEEYNDEDVLEGLKPPAYLKRLKIHNFKGKKFSSWMISESHSSVVLQNLVDIRLENCNRCEGIPPLGHLPNLKVISVNNMRNVKRIGEEFYGGRGDAKTISIMFPSLRRLRLEKMPKLEEWMEAVTVHDPLPSTQLFPYLEQLEISGCNNLMILPSHFPALKILSIWGINSVSLEKICTKLNCLTSLILDSIKGGSLELNSSIVNGFLGNNKSLRELWLTCWDALPDFLAIENQQVSCCPNPSSISAPVSTSLIGLEDLRIGPFLKDLDHFPWPIYGFSFVSSLNRLDLIGWPKLKSLPEQLQCLSSLTQLLLREFDGLEALPDWLGNLSSLRDLELFKCRNLVRMPTLEALKSLINLKRLSIDNCKLLSERCAKESGPEWYKIAHIPKVTLDSL